uniref:Uncharacterized protein n=1 Tax=Moniliophthora roreri TaxID=221103 RepID=A0A0W0F4U5_MONRR
MNKFLALEAHLKELKKIQKEVETALQMEKEKMKKAYEAEKKKMQDARSLSTSVHAPKSGSTNDLVQKVHFSKNTAICPPILLSHSLSPISSFFKADKKKNKKVPSKSLNATSTAPEAKLTTSASKKNVNIISHLDEQALYALAFESIAKKSALIPFLDLEKASSKVLLSVTNFLCAELSSLEHNIHFYIGQYQVSSKSLEEVNCICLSKVAIQDEQIGKAQPIHSTIEVETVPAPVDT